jgi:iron complex transport system substrate-binding protein
VQNFSDPGKIPIRLCVAIQGKFCAAIILIIAAFFVFKLIKFLDRSNKMKRYNKNLLTMLLVVLVAFSLAACGTKSNNNGGTNDITNGATNEITEGAANGDKDTTGESVELPTVDRAGNTITIPKEVNKIISLAPSTTQILFDLGVGDKLVAVDTQSPLYSTIPSEIPQFDMMAPDLEQVIALSPDVVFVSSMTNFSGEDILKVVRDSGICVLEIPTSNSIEDIKTDIRFVADAVGKSQEGKVLVSDMEAIINQVAEIGSKITDKKTVLFEIAAAPDIYSFGKNVFLNEMIELIGASNIFADQDGWISVSGEAIVNKNPDVILTSVNYIENPAEEIKSRDGFNEITAVLNDRVYYIDNGYSSLPNHNVTKALIEMAKAVYPEQFANFK